jgi:hypothetical protein
MRTVRVGVLVLSLVVLGFALHMLFATPAQAIYADQYLSTWNGDYWGWRTYCSNHGFNWACPASGGDTKCVTTQENPECQLLD